MVCRKTTRSTPTPTRRPRQTRTSRTPSLDWTILRPSALTLDAATGHIESGDGVSAGRVSRGNVAHVIRSVVSHPGTTARRVIAFNDGHRPIDEVVTGD